MAFDRNNFRSNYSTDDSSLLDDFYIPTLKSAVRYDRAVGYFSAGILSYALQGLAGFAENKGVMRLIIGDELDESEYNAIKNGEANEDYQLRLQDRLRTLLEEHHGPLFDYRLDILSWMVRANALTIRLAVRPKGIYHEKIGILTDKLEDCVVFQGSANETPNALRPDFNCESISVYPSWKPEIFDEYGRWYRERFERLWNREMAGSYILDLPSELYDLIRQRYQGETAPRGNESDLYRQLLNFETDANRPRIPEHLNNEPYVLGKHQEEAIQEWSGAGYKGIFALATGAGKTITALHAAVRVYEALSKRSNKNTCLIISVPYQVLGDQWSDVARLFNINVIQCYRSRTIWYQELRRQISNFNLFQDSKLLAIVVVHRTLMSDGFQELISTLNKSQVLFVGDECHHDHTRISKLPNVNMRIGLSATPWGSNEHERRQLLTSYYGDVVARYTIDRALSDGVLSPYDYYFYLCPMDSEEWDEYQTLQREIGALLSIKENGGKINESLLQIKYGARARLLGSIRSKFEKLQSVVESLPRSTQNLFYCGAGSDDSEEGSRPIRDINRITQLLHDIGWATSKFTADEGVRERKEILAEFQGGHINGMVAIRVLDEGIDIPSCSQSFLIASSRSERQYIQRRGRVLRKSKTSTYSVIHDFVVIPDSAIDNAASRSLVHSELKRVYEFVRVARNHEKMIAAATDVATTWGLTMSDIIEEAQIYIEGNT